MARHKPEPVLSPAPVITEKANLTLAERLSQAEYRLAQSETIAESCYWQGAVDALNAYSQGTTMPEAIGAGVKKS